MEKADLIRQIEVRLSELLSMIGGWIENRLENDPEQAAEYLVMWHSEHLKKELFRLGLRKSQKK